MKNQVFAATGINRQINFQGKLVNNPSGTNVTNTSYTVVFTIYDRPEAGQGTALWTETQTVTTTDGIFRVALGSVNPIPASFNFNWSGLYLGIKVNAPINDPEMTPRVQLAAVPMAFNAQQVAGLTVQDDAGNASTSATLQIANAKTVTFKGTNQLTFNDAGGSTTISFPASGSITLVDTGTTQTLTNKIIGSGGLTFTGAATDITTGTNEDFLISPNGTGMFGINTTTTLSSIDLRGNPVTGGTLSIASVSGKTSFASLVVNNDGLGDLFTASASGWTRFVINNLGAIGLSSGFGVTGQCLQSNGSATSATWGVCGGGGGAFTESAGAIVPLNSTEDFMLGSQASSSARFRVIANNLGAGTLGVASVSGRTSFAALVVNNDGVGDLFTASASGWSRFTIMGNGSLVANAYQNNGGILFTTPTGLVGQTTPGLSGQCLISNGGGAPTFAGCASGPTGNWWTLQSAQGTLYPINTTLDLLWGGTSSLSASFKLTGNTIKAGTLQVASISGKTSFATLVTNNDGVGDLFTASSSGWTRFSIDQGGSVTQWGNLNFSGTNSIAQIQTLTNQHLSLNAGGLGLIGINTDGITPRANFDLRANIGTLAIASISGATSYAALAVDNSGVGNLIAASSSGNTLFVVRQDGSVGLGNGTNSENQGYTFDVIGNARIGTSNSTSDDILKQTTADFTVSGSSITTVESSNTPTVSTTDDQLQLVTDLIGAGATLTAPSAGPGTVSSIGPNALTFQRPDRKFVLLTGNGTRIYDSNLNVFGGGPAFTTGSVGNGLNVFQRADGNFVVVMGGGTATQIYSPGANTNQQGTFTLGPVTSAAVGAGSTVIRRSDGKILLIHGGGVATTSVYDPTNNAFIVGPTLTGNVTTGSFQFTTPTGKWVVGLGGAATTNIYDPTTTNGIGGGGSFVAGSNMTGSTGAGAHAIQLPDGRFMIFLGGGSGATTIYDPGTNSFAVGNNLASGQTIGAGAHSFQRSDGKWIVVLGGNSTNLQIFDPNGGVNNNGSFGTITGLQGATGAGGGAHSFQRPDGMYITVHGAGNAGAATALTTLYDAGWNTSGTWTSEDINNTKISTYSAMTWSANPQSANNNARLDPETIVYSVKTSTTQGGLAGASWVTLHDSGNLIKTVQSAAWVKIKVDFYAPVRSYPQSTTGLISQTNIWPGEGGIFYRRTFIQPTVFSLKIQAPVVSYGDLSGQGDPAFGRNFASSAALFEGVVTDNSNMLKLTTNRNLPAATPSAGFIIASAAANLGVNAAAGTHTIERSTGQFLVIIGGSTSTRVYDPTTNTFSAGPTLPLAAGAGAHSFLLPDGRFFTVLGNANNTAIFDPQANVFVSGPRLYGTVGTGANTFLRPDGFYIIINGGATAVTNILDPLSMAITQGPNLAGGQVAGAGSLNIRRPDGRIIVLSGNAASVSSIYDPASNSFAVGPVPTAAIGAGSSAIQLFSGKFWIKSSATTTSMIYDPNSNTPATYAPFIAGSATTGTNAAAGALIIPRSDGKFLYMSGTTSTVIDQANTVAAQVAGPAVPCTLGAGSNVFQRSTGEYVVICGNSAGNTFIIDAGWNLGGTYTSEPVFTPNLSSQTGMYWKNYSSLGEINVKYKTATTSSALGLSSWKQLPTDGSLLSPSAGDTWFQTRIDLTGFLQDMPGAKTRVWLSESNGGVVVYYRQVQAPILQYWKLINNAYPNLLTLVSNGSSIFRFNADGQAFTSDGGAWNSGGADLAERYTSTQELKPGEVVVGDRSQTQNVVRSTNPYQTNIMGVVSTQPGFVAGAYTPNSYPIALVGRVPVKVSTESGQIHSGDYLTAGSIPGVAMKATVTGRVLGTALEDFDSANAKECLATVSGVLPETQCGTIMAFINLTNYNGENVQVLMAERGINYWETSSQSSTLTFLEYLQSQNSNPAASILANSINVLNKVITPEIITNNLKVLSENIFVEGQNLRDYIANIVNEQLSSIQNLTSNSIVSPIASIDTIHTNVISPLANDSKIALKIENDKFSIVNGNSASASAVSSFDNQGNATFSGELTSDNLQVTNNASISGTLRVGKIIADQIESLNNENFGLIKGNITAAAPSKNPIFTTVTSGNYVNLATFSSQLGFVANFGANTLHVSQNLISSGQTLLSDTSINGQLNIGGNLILANNNINAVGGDLNLQPLRQGGLSVMAGLFYIGTDGNATFGSDVTVKGSLYANTISPIPGNDLTIKLSSESSQLQNTKYKIQNTNGSDVLSVNSMGDLIASGEATISKLNFNLVAPALAVSPTEVIATGSAGTAEIKPYFKQVTIDNKLVTEKSLIYITPTTVTNQVIFLLKQVPGKSFTVGVQNESTTPIQFNWMIVN